ncbi:MAG: hypothetical protein OXG85_15430 [Chloroflexi bacterium]|nr:hypothetical protein [Chloroflexota bacterium]
MTSRAIEVSARLGRSLTIITGIAVLIWSSLEDSDAVLVTTLGTLSATTATIAIFSLPSMRERLPRGDLRTRAAIRGALIGALAAITTALLMLFKDLRHAHIFPDYPPGMMLETLEKLPIWALAGGLAGFGIGSLVMLGRDWAKVRRR